MLPCLPSTFRQPTKGKQCCPIQSSTRWNCSSNLQREITQIMNVILVIHVPDTLSWPDLHDWEVPWNYFKGYSLFKSQSSNKTVKEDIKGESHYSEVTEAKVTILVIETLSWSVLHNCEVSWKDSKWYWSYNANKKKFMDRLTAKRMDELMPGSSRYPLNLSVEKSNGI